MPRRPRLHVPGACYHVILRGNHQEDLFSTPADRAVLNNIVGEALPLYGARIHAFCWMTNHLHALIQIADRKLGDCVQRIAVRYSRYRHKQLGTTGHLFERRHRAFLVETDLYFITLLRYIHLNPVTAGMVKTAVDYAWSSHRAYLGLEAVPWLTTDFGLSMFGKTDAIARRHYRIMVNGELYASELSVFEQANPNDPRVLGSDDFLATLAKPKQKARNKPTLEKLIEEVCKRNGVTVASVSSSSRLRSLSNARTEIARRAVYEGIASVREVAKRLDKCPSGMCKQLQRRDT